MGINGDNMKKMTTNGKTKKYFDFHLRLPLDLSKIFIADAKKDRRKYAKQMSIILEKHYQLNQEQ